MMDAGYVRYGFARLVAVTLGVCGVVGVVGAVEAVPEEALGELEQLRRNVEILRERDGEQVRALNVLHERLKAIEGRSSTPPATAQPAQPAPRPPEPAVPEPSVAESVAEATPDVAGFQSRLSLETGFSYSHFDRQQLALQGFLALDAIFLGRISVDEIKSDTVTWDFGAHYRPLERLQLDLAVPFLYRETVYRSGGANGASSTLLQERIDAGPEVGDASLGLGWDLLRESLSHPSLTLSFNVKAPTGSDPYGVDVVEVEGGEGNLSVPRELPTGNGIWSYSAGVTLLRTLDPAVLFSNFGVTYNPAQSFDDIDSQAGSRSPGEVRLGDSLQFGFGIGYALNERLSVTLSYAQQLKRKSEIRNQGQPWQSLVGSEANTVTFNNSVTYVMGPHWSMASSLGIGLSDDAPDFSFGIKGAYGF